MASIIHHQSSKNFNFTAEDHIYALERHKSAKWADRLQTPEEKAKAAAERAADAQRTMEKVQMAQAKRLAAVWSRGMGTIVGGN